MSIEKDKSEPEPWEFTKRARNIASHEISKPRNTFEITILEACEIIDRLKAELKAKDELLQKSATYLRRQSNIGKEQMDFIKQMEQALKEALTMAKELWASVGNHPASRYKYDVDYFEKALKGEQKSETS